MIMQAERKPMEQPVEAHADHKVPLDCIVAVHDVGAQLSIHKSGQQVLSLSASLCVLLVEPPICVHKDALCV